MGVISNNKWTTLFDNDEVVVEQDKDGNYRVSFFEDNHWKDEFIYTKWKNTDEYKRIEKQQEEHPSIEEQLQILKEIRGIANVSDYVPDCCKGCSAHPSNGGSGICNCAAPYLAKTSPWVLEHPEDYSNCPPSTSTSSDDFDVKEYVYSKYLTLD